MATGQITKDDRTSEIAIFARLIKADETDLSRELARYILTLGFDEEDQDRMSELAERNQEGALSAEEQTSSELRQGRASAGLAPLQGEEVAEGAGRSPEGVMDAFVGQEGARAGRPRLRVLPNAPSVLSDGPVPDRPYHRPPAWRGHDARQPGPLLPPRQ